MNVMVSAHPYWVPVYRGLQAGRRGDGLRDRLLGHARLRHHQADRLVRAGSGQEAQAGILLHPMQSDPFIEPINRAIESGVDDRDLRGRLAEVEAHLLHHLRQSRRGQVRGRGDRQAARRQGRIRGAGESRARATTTCASPRFIAYMEKNYPEHEAGRPPGVQPGQQRGLPGDRSPCCRPIRTWRRCGSRRPARPKARSRRCSRPRPRSHHARRRHADDARAHQGRQHPHGAQPEPGHPGLHGLPRHLPGGASRPDRPVQRLQGARATTRCSIPFIDNGFAVITKDNADDFDLNKYMEGRDPS